MVTDDLHAHELSTRRALWLLRSILTPEQAEIFLAHDYVDVPDQDNAKRFFRVVGSLAPSMNIWHCEHRRNRIVVVGQFCFQGVYRTGVPREDYFVEQILSLRAHQARTLQRANKWQFDGNNITVVDLGRLFRCSRPATYFPQNEPTSFWQKVAFGGEWFAVTVAAVLAGIILAVKVIDAASHGAGLP